jgi:hypothetical protein
MAGGKGMDCSTGQGATILPFDRGRRRRHGLGVSERIQALQWADAVRPLGVRSVQFHEPEPGDDPVVGAFMLIYRVNDLWAAWGVARRGPGFEVWRPSTGLTVGLYTTIATALGAIFDLLPGTCDPGDHGVSLRIAR